jgi:glycosyltransferase involved in cell wall biosynthesis
MTNRVPKKICLAALSCMVSGTERVLGDIAAQLIQQSPEGAASIGLLLGNQPPFKPFAEPFIRQGVPVEYFGDVRYKSEIRRNFVNSFRFFRRHRPDVLHAHCPTYRWGLEVLIAARLSGVPCIVRTEQNPLMAPPYGLPGTLLKLTDRFVSRFTYVSQGNQERFERFLPYRTARGQVIPNAIDPEKYKPNLSPDEERRRVREMFGFPPQSQIALGVVSPFGERRSPEPILRAFQKLLTEPRTASLARMWRLVLLGMEESEGCRFATELGINEYVLFTKRRNDLPELLPSCDLMVSAAHFEGMSIMMMEALACGMDLLTTEVDGITDILGTSVAGDVMVPHQDTNAYAQAWWKIMQCHADGKRLLQPHASDVVRRDFTTSLMLERYLAMLQTASS